MKKKLKMVLKSPLTYIFLFSICLYLTFFVKNPGLVFHHPEVFGQEVSIYGSVDASKYAKMSWQLLRKGIYGYTGEQPDAFVTPGQPLYLAILFKTADLLNTNHVMLVKLINMLLSIGTIVLIYKVIYELFANKKIAIIGSVLYLTYFPPLHYFRTLLTEIPSIFLFMLAIYFLVLAYKKERVYFHLLFGIIASIMLMFRPTPAPLLLIAYVAILKKYRLKTAIRIGFIWCIGPLLVMSPWVIRNIIVLGEPYLFSSHSGDVLLAGADPYNLKGYENITKEMYALGFQNSEEDRETYAKMLIRDGFENQFSLWFSWFTIGKTIALYQFPDSIQLYYGIFPEWLYNFTFKQHYLVVYIGALSGIFFRTNKKILTIFIAVIVYTLLSNIFLAIPRYGAFIIPLFCILAAYGLYEFIKKISIKLTDILPK